MNQFFCPRGFHCPEGSGSPVPCSGESGVANTGRYQNIRGMGSCKECPVGYYCFNEANPTAGIMEPAPCEKGHYCPINTGDYREYICPVGTYGGITGMRSEDDCTPCWGGFFCDEEGSISGDGITPESLVPKLCEAGYYCPTGSRSGTENDCPPGAFCPEGTILYLINFFELHFS